MPTPLHSPWSRWVPWIFKDIPTLLSIWAPSAQPLMFNADRHTGPEVSKALHGLWTRSGQGLSCLQKGMVEQDSCISVPRHIIEKRLYIHKYSVLGSKTCGALEENHSLTNMTLTLPEASFSAWKWILNWCKHEVHGGMGHTGGLPLFNQISHWVTFCLSVNYGSKNAGLNTGSSVDI